ncbi:MAG: ATP-binding protein [Pseudomonadota bacterium]
MKIAIGSGKGGTGKTTLSVGLALALTDKDISVHLIDCDVEEPNAHLFLKVTNENSRSVDVFVPDIDTNLCTLCGECAKFCQFKALAAIPNSKILIFKEMCHGCGGCEIVCPEKAIKEVFREVGVIKTSQSKNLDFTYGILNIGEAMATPVIRALKEIVNPTKTTIFDAPPGTACSFVETVIDSDYCILVTEPTPFGLFDLKIAVEVVKKINIPFGVVINRSNIGNKSVTGFCENNAIPILMQIPYDKNVAIAYSKGIPITDVDKKYGSQLLDMFKTLKASI